MLMRMKLLFYKIVALCYKAVKLQQPYLICLLLPYIPEVIYVRPTVNSLHRQALVLVGSYAAPPPFGTVFPHLYALLTVSL